MNGPLEDDKQRRFHYLLVLPVMTTGFSLSLLWGIYLLMRAPDFVSPRGVFFLLLFLIVGAFSWGGSILLWWANYTFELTDNAPVATHWLTRRRRQVGWDEISRVHKKPRLFRGTVSITMLELMDGHAIPVARPGLLRYAEFFAELKKGATKCRSFDYYVNRWDA